MIDATPQHQSLYRGWLEAQLESSLSNKSVFIANVDTEIRGVIGFDRYTGDSIEMFMAGCSPNWLTRRLIKVAFSYVFNQLGCARCTGLVNADNRAALDIDTRLGFVQEGVMRQANNGTDVVVLGMLKTECRWI